MTRPVEVPLDRCEFFPNPGAMRAWLEAHHDREAELWVGFHKRATGEPSVTWPQAVDEALCFGWIDGVRKGVDATRYAIRFTPRKPRSVWSAVNIRRVAALTEEGRMRPAGERAFAARREERSRLYSYENRANIALAPELQRALAKDRAAARFFAAQAPWYQRAAIHWVMSAKKDATREKRFAELVAASAEGRPVPPLSRPGKG